MTKSFLPFLLSCFTAFAVEPLELYNPATCVAYSLNNTPQWPDTYCRNLFQWYLDDTGQASQLWRNGVFQGATEPGGNADLNLPAGLRADGVIVGVIDTGAKADHPDLSSAILGGCFISERASPVINEGQFADFDPNGHGTGIASIIAAERNDIGMAGVAPGAKLLIVSTGLALPETTEQVAKGIEWLVNRGATIICMNWGETTEQNTALYMAMNYAAHNGVIVVSGIRYGGNLDQTPTYPYGWNQVNYLAVAATTRTGALYPPSATGSRVVGAPGDRIVMASTDDPWVYDNGNSFASPMVAGVIALMKAKQPYIRRSQFFLNRIKASAALHPVAGIIGRVDAAAALEGL